MGCDSCIYNLCEGTPCIDCKNHNDGGCRCLQCNEDGIFYTDTENKGKFECPYYKEEKTMNTYKSNMHSVPAEIHAEICKALDQIGKDNVHISYASMLEGDNDDFCVIAAEQQTVKENCYSLHSYSAAEHKLYRSICDITYYDALRLMSERICE